MEDVRQVNAERGMLGYTGTYRGNRVSVQASGMGCPSAAITIEELVQLGVRRIVRVGTCGGLQPDLSLGDLIIAISATPADPTALHYTGGEPHAPTASWELVHGAVHAAKELGQKPRVGPVVSSNVFYDPDDDRAKRWSERGILAVEMEAAVLFTLGALREVRRRLPVDRERHLPRRRVRAHHGRGDAPRGQRHDRARPASRSRRNGTERTARRVRRQSGLRQRVDRATVARDRTSRGRGRARRRDAVLGAAGADPGARRAGRRTTEPSSSSPSAGTGRSTRSSTASCSSASRAPSRPSSPSSREEPARTSSARSASRRGSRTPSRSSPSGSTRTIDAGHVAYRSWDGSPGQAWFANVASAGMSGAVAQRANSTSKAMGGKVSFLWAHAGRLRALEAERDGARGRRRASKRPVLRRARGQLPLPRAAA